MPGHNARYGILLDMVGGKDATFYQEGYSREYAAPIVSKVWKAAKQIGFGKYFLNEIILNAFETERV